MLYLSNAALAVSRREQLTIIGFISSALLVALKKEISDYRKKKKQAEAERLSWVDDRVFLWFLDNPTEAATIEYLAAVLALALSDVRDSLYRLAVKQKIAPDREHWRLRKERGERSAVA